MCPVIRGSHPTTIQNVYLSFRNLPVLEDTPENKSNHITMIPKKRREKSDKVQNLTMSIPTQASLLPSLSECQVLSGGTCPPRI